MKFVYDIYPPFQADDEILVKCTFWQLRPSNSWENGLCGMRMHTNKGRETSVWGQQGDGTSCVFKVPPGLAIVGVQRAPDYFSCVVGFRVAHPVSVCELSPFF